VYLPEKAERWIFEERDYSNISAVYLTSPSERIYCSGIRIRTKVIIGVFQGVT